MSKHDDRKLKPKKERPAAAEQRPRESDTAKGQRGNDTPSQRELELQQKPLK